MVDRFSQCRNESSTLFIIVEAIPNDFLYSYENSAHKTGS